MDVAGAGDHAFDAQRRVGRGEFHDQRQRQRIDAIARGHRAVGAAVAGDAEFRPSPARQMSVALNCLPSHASCAGCSSASFGASLIERSSAASVAFQWPSDFGCRERKRARKRRAGRVELQLVRLRVPVRVDVDGLERETAGRDFLRTQRQRSLRRLELASRSR